MTASRPIATDAPDSAYQPSGDRGRGADGVAVESVECVAVASQGATVVDGAAGLAGAAAAAVPKEVAHELGIATKTVETHVSAVLRKLQLSNRYELSRWAADRRLI